MSKTQRLRPSQGGKFAAPVGPSDHPALTRSDAVGACAEGEPRQVAMAIRTVSPPDWGDVAIDARYPCALSPCVEWLPGVFARPGDVAPIGRSRIKPEMFRVDATSFFFGSPSPEETAGAIAEQARRASERPVIDEELERERVRLLGKRVRAVFGDDHPIHGETVTDVERRSGAVRFGVGGPIYWIPECFEPIPEESAKPLAVDSAKPGDRVERIRGGLQGTVDHYDLPWRMVMVDYGGGVGERMPIADFVRDFRLVSTPRGGA